MRNIKYIAIHCTAGRQTQTINDLRAEFKARGWKNPGYHYVVSPDGTISQLLDIENVSNGVHGYNSVSINVAYIGGVDGPKLTPVDNRTEKQKTSLRSLLKLLKRQYPNAVIQGHKDFPGVAKACPCFDAKKEYKDL